MTPLLSIVVPTRNRRALLERTLPTLIAQDLGPSDFEVVVVSDGSTDGTLGYLASVTSRVPVRVVDRAGGGLAAARNAGIAAALGTVVLLMDDDMVCGPALARTHLLAHADAPESVVCGPTLTHPSSRPGLATEYARRWYAAYAARLTRDGCARSEHDVWVTSNCSAPRRLFEAHHGYDEAFAYSEDAELAIRLWRAGVPFRFLASGPAHEVYSKTASDVVRVDAPRLGVGELQLCRKYPDYTGRSLLASAVAPSRAKRALGRFCATAVISPDVVLVGPYLALELLARVPGFAALRRPGTVLLAKRMAVRALRAAARRAGSWSALQQELGEQMRLAARAAHQQRAAPHG